MEKIGVNPIHSIFSRSPSAAILTLMDGYGGSPAAAPTPLAGAKSGDFEVEACPVGS